jgi:hypothetical protein
LLVLSIVVTLLNCAKPLHIDDAAYVQHATHIASHPLAPYDSVIYWDYQFQQGNTLLAPPVLLYWLAGARAVLGESPVLWKLAQYPLNLLLVGSLFVLVRRWAERWALALTWMTVLSPALLPSLNLMLDVPALALSLTALTVFMCASDCRSLGLAIVAGLIAGLAAQTKYTAIVTPVVLLAFGFMHGRLRLAVVACIVAVLLFAAWEGFVAVQHGSSHFFLAANNRSGAPWSRMRHLLLPTASLTAALAPGALFLALLTRRNPWRWLAMSILSVLGGLVVLGMLPDHFNEWCSRWLTSKPLRIDEALYIGLTAAWWLAVGGLLWRHWCWQRWEDLAARFGNAPAQFKFLLLWLAIELMGAIALSPFPAARRVLGVAVVATILVGFVIARHAIRPAMVWCAAGAAIAVGLFVALIDIHEARATQQLADRAIQIAQQQNPQHKNWFSGAWAFQYYAMQHGMVPLDPVHSQLHAGDLVFLVEQQLDRIDFHPEAVPLAREAVVTLGDDVPWRTVLSFYCGAAPLKHHEGPRLRFVVYRALADFQPQGMGRIQPAR